MIEIYGNNPRDMKIANPKCIKQNVDKIINFQYLLNHGIKTRKGPINSNHKLLAVKNGKIDCFVAKIKPKLETNISAFKM